jgi:hypothetical protein
LSAVGFEICAVDHQHLADEGSGFEEHPHEGIEDPFIGFFFE